jgi:hypothetical protein
LVGSGYIGLTDGNGAAAVLAYPLDLALDNLGNLFVAEQGNPTVRKVSIASRDVKTVMNGYTYNGYSGQGITVSSSGIVYLYSMCALYRLSPDGKGGLGPSSPNFDSRYESITGGYFGCGYSDATPPTSGGKIGGLIMSAIDSQGNLIFSDTGNNAIRKITLVDKAPTGTQYQLSK